MDTNTTAQSLLRTNSQHSSSSVKSARSQTVRARSRKNYPFMSSSASSVNTLTSTSDKSLTSFPSFSPEPIENDNSVLSSRTDGKDISERTRTVSSYVSLNNDKLEDLSAKTTRNALFNDAPLSPNNVPGAIHNLTTKQIEILIARNGAVALVRQIAKDLAERDAQVAAIRWKADERERALKKIISECGLSNLALETKLRAIEEERKATTEANNDQSSETGLENLMIDAMSNGIRGETVSSKSKVDYNATIRAVDKLRTFDEPHRTVSKGWRDFIWGGTSRKTSRANSLTRDTGATNESITSRAGPTKVTRKTVLLNEIFKPPETSNNNGPKQLVNDKSHHDRKTSIGPSAFTLRFMSGKRDLDPDLPRGRSSSTGASLNVSRVSSTEGMKTSNSTRTSPLESILVKSPSEEIFRSQQQLKSVKSIRNNNLKVLQERGDTTRLSCINSIISSPIGKLELSGPVEMDTILPLNEQPPTFSQIYNKHCDQEFLTDRFGFIYDQRRRKRHKEAEMMQRSKLKSGTETLKSARSNLSINHSYSDASPEIEEEEEDGKSESTASIEGAIENKNLAKRWQDHLSIATFPTELLSHSPCRAILSLEVMKSAEAPRSPSILSEERGFFPSTNITASQPTLVVTSDNAIISKPFTASPPTTLEQPVDIEPVKLLLKQLGDVHDCLQREKTIKWNDFMRKVRAERRRDGEAAASNPSSLSDSRSKKTIESMPEATLTNGEMIGVAGLGNKGKVGRAKWNEFKSLVLAGIPVAYRAKIWAECSGASALRIPGYYKSLIAKPKSNDDAVIIAQIEMDVNRTLTDNIYFRKGPGVSKLYEVLLAYSRRNPEVGYCQGMNLITACLLLVMPTAEDTFWFLTSIIENILPRGYYDHSLMSSRADQQVLRQYVSEILPRLSNHFENLSIDLEALTFQWFLSVFTDCLSAEALFRVWDVVFCTNDGSTFLFQVALALLKLNEPQLLKCDTPAEVYTYINHQMTNHAISVDGLIQASEGLRKVVKREAVENRRARAIEAEKAHMRHREEISTLRLAERLATTQSRDDG